MKKNKAIIVVAAAIQKAGDREGRILVVRRGPGQSGAGHWEFPGGKVEDNETPHEALVREISEELGADIEVGEFISDHEHEYPDKTIHLLLYWAFLKNEHIELREHDAMKWLRPSEMNVADLSPADQPFVEILRTQSF
jgi:mutator protein MutT